MLDDVWDVRADSDVACLLGYNRDKPRQEMSDNDFYGAAGYNRRQVRCNRRPKKLMSRIGLTDAKFQFRLSEDRHAIM